MEVNKSKPTQGMYKPGTLQLNPITQTNVKIFGGHLKVKGNTGVTAIVFYGVVVAEHGNDDTFNVYA